MTPAAPHCQQRWAYLLIEELVRCGVDTFFVAPGSRSTPLMVAVARHREARRVSHFDERAAAFAALGFGRSAGRPAALVTTSGTAVANAQPAVVEASVDGVPMLLLTADRPPEKRGTGANQTIDQVKLFGGYVRWQFDLPVPTPEIAPEMVLTTADQAVGFARRRPPGPVHLNCMFRKPLEPSEGERAAKVRTDLPAGLEQWAESTRPYTTRPLARPTAAPEALDALAERLRGTKRGLVIAGRLDADARAARRLADALGWPLLPDATSRLRLSGDAVSYADQLLAGAAFRQACPPEAVVHVGGRTVSKRLRRFLKACRPSPYVVARPDPRRLDPDHRVTRHLETEVAAFADALAERLDPPAEKSPWLCRWHAADAAAEHALRAFAAGALSEPLSEPLAARLVSRHLAPKSALILGSSMPVRDFNRYAAAPGGGAPTPVFANRGASGIDGTVATAAGVHEGFRAEGDERPVTLLLGDLALLHDLNALALLAGRAVTIVVLNNGGGGIFHFLPIAAHTDVFEPHFTTPHDVSFEEAAAMFGLAYQQPSTPDAFAACYRAAAERAGPSLIEVRTDREENRALHEVLEDRVAAAVEDELAEETL